MCGPRQHFFFQCGPETPKCWAPLVEKELRDVAKPGEWVPLFLKQGRRSPASLSPFPPTPALLAQRFFHTSSPFPLTVDVFSFRYA